MIKSNVFHKIPISTPFVSRTPKFKPNYGMFLDATAVPRHFTVRDTIKHVIGLQKEKDPFYVVHLSNVESQHERWTQNLPNVHPHYAIKSNPDRRIIQTLHSLGAKFDCASQKEIQDVLAITKDPKKIIFANPIKMPHHLEYAAAVGVDRVTADNVSELEKLRFFHKNAKILIRMKPDDSKSICRFSTKFGATIEEAVAMLDYARKYNLDIIGTSFHVGSGCQSAETYSAILRDCAEIFSMGSDLGFHMHLLNIGGGFPGLSSGHQGDSFEAMSVVISDAVGRMFSQVKDLEVIGEPGRFFSEGAASLVTSVVGKKEFDSEGKTGFKYYIDEGVYGGFNCIVFDHSHPVLEIVKPRLNSATHHSIVFGPTCDSMDKIGEFEMPELFVGDKLFVESFGAYTSTSSSAFNGFKNMRRYYVYKD
jgi:ornithine decarboxylase